MTDAPDRMGPLDAAFWALEDAHASLHVASLAVFEGPAPAQSAVVTAFRHKIVLVPRFRQVMRPVPLGLGRPVWVDDRRFDLGYHLRRTAVVAPGGEAQLQELVGRLMSAPLDPDRPLWEMWVVEGLEGGRWALVTKVHHSVVDGIAGMAVLSQFLDATPDATLPRLRRWDPEPAPGALRLVRGALSDRVSAAGEFARGAGSLALRPWRAVRAGAADARGAVAFVAALRPTPRSSLTGSIGASRRYVWLALDQAEITAVRRALGGTRNDVVLAIATRGFRHLLLSRREHLTGRSVRCLVPVSVRTANRADDADNQVSAMFADLPVHLADPRATHEAVVAETRRLKASHEAAAGELMTELAAYLPPPAVTAGLNLAARLPQHWLTTVVTNVPGLRAPQYLCGRRLIANYPYVPIADRLRIGIAVSSYDRSLCVGITCDRTSVPDVQVLTDGIRAGLAELVDVVHHLGEASDADDAAGADAPTTTSAPRIGRQA